MPHGRKKTSGQPDLACALVRRPSARCALPPRGTHRLRKGTGCQILLNKSVWRWPVSVSKTAGRSPAEREMTFNTSAVAACCCSSLSTSRLRSAFSLFTFERSHFRFSPPRHFPASTPHGFASPLRDSSRIIAQRVGQRRWPGERPVIRSARNSLRWPLNNLISPRLWATSSRGVTGDPAPSDDVLDRTERARGRFPVPRNRRGSGFTVNN